MRIGEYITLEIFECICYASGTAGIFDSERS
jgi:hypothetical protein